MSIARARFCFCSRLWLRPGVRPWNGTRLAGSRLPLGYAGAASGRLGQLDEKVDLLSGGPRFDHAEHESSALASLETVSPRRCGGARELLPGVPLEEESEVVPEIRIGAERLADLGR